MASPALIQSVLESVPGFVILTDLDLRIEYINRTHAGFQRSQVVGRSWYEFVTPDQARTIRHALLKLAETGEPQSYEVSMETPDGTTRWYRTEISEYRPADLGHTGYISISTEITERRTEPPTS